MLPLKLPIYPMEALQADQLPIGPEWQYEPKWDGFRCIAVKDEDTVRLYSKATKDLTRYFPELKEGISKIKAKRFVLDGEIVIPLGKELSFDELLSRIHPAESRIKKLAADRPALYIVFDMLVNQAGKSLVERALGERRAELEKFAGLYFKDTPLRLSPVALSIKAAERWRERAGNALDGLIAKRADASYEPSGRESVIKVKNYRSADCVVGGFRYSSKRKAVGSLLLGLYDDDGLLHHVGHIGSLEKKTVAELTKQLLALAAKSGFTGRAPGGPSRWSTERSGEWEPVKPKLVVEVSYDHFTGGRFRHGTKLLRWRPDKSPRQCTFAQLEQGAGSLLELLPSGRDSRKKAA
jgi:ATP-dependent DNA ligase